MKYSILFILFGVVSAFGQQDLDHLLSRYNKGDIPYTSVSELRRLQTNDSIVILDAREMVEFNTSHIASAIHCGYSTFSAEKISEIIKPLHTPIVVYCSLGIRSEDIAQRLKKVGFTEVKNLYGGIFEWKNKEYPVVNSRSEETDSIHAFSKMWSKWLKKGIPVYTKSNKNE